MAARSIDETQVRARCGACGRVLSFDEWSSGYELCAGCARGRDLPGPAAAFVHGPAAAPRTTPAAPLPEELIAELIAAVEAEARAPSAESHGAFGEVLAEIGIRRSTRQLQWAAWGFAAGFGTNVAVVKYAQMVTSAPMTQFAGPLVIGGVVAGGACALIGWGIARLREG